MVTPDSSQHVENYTHATEKAPSWHGAVGTPAYRDVGDLRHRCAAGFHQRRVFLGGRGVSVLPHIERHFTLTNLGIPAGAWIALSHWSAAFQVATWFLLPFVTLSFGLAQGSVLGRLNKLDYSYGIYTSMRFPCSSPWRRYGPA